MRFIFAQTAELCIKNISCSDFLTKLPQVICEHTDLYYTYNQTNTGCFLKPTFRNMLYRNSFVPEIDVVVCRNDAQTFLQISGQPVKLVRIFMAFWFSFLLITEIFLLLLAGISKLDNLFPVLIPIVLCAFGYLLCKFTTKITFESVIKAIKKELA